MSAMTIGPAGASGTAPRTMDLLMRDIGRVPPLRPHEQIALARRIERGDRQARARMVEGNLRLVVAIASRHRDRGLPLEDLVQEGVIGLMRAVDLFDHRRGTAFSTYATWWIRQAVTSAVARQSRAIRLPARQVHALARIRRREAEIARLPGAAPRAAELARDTGVPVADVELLRLRDAAVRSLDEPAGSGVRRRAELVGDDGAPSPEEAALRDEERAIVGGAVARLDARSRRVVRDRFGVGGREPRTLAAIGRDLRLSRERVRQIQERALIDLAHQPEVVGLRAAA